MVHPAERARLIGLQPFARFGAVAFLDLLDDGGVGGLEIGLGRRGLGHAHSNDNDNRGNDQKRDHADDDDHQLARSLLLRGSAHDDGFCGDGRGGLHRRRHLPRRALRQRAFQIAAAEDAHRRAGVELLAAVGAGELPAVVDRDGGGRGGGLKIGDPVLRFARGLIRQVIQLIHFRFWRDNRYRSCTDCRAKTV